MLDLWSDRISCCSLASSLLNECEVVHKELVDVEVLVSGAFRGEVGRKFAEFAYAEGAVGEFGTGVPDFTRILDGRFGMNF